MDTQKPRFARAVRSVCTAVAMTGLAMASTTAAADSLMPDFDGAPNGWTTDRFQPVGFVDVGSYQGRDDVLQIRIDSSTDAANRPAGQQSSFYNTQGMQHAVSGGAGSVLAADLYIERAWADANNGFVRTDMWGVMSSGEAVAAYTILGFTNHGGAARLRAWDGDLAAGWVDLDNVVIQYGAWNALSIVFTGSAFEYYVNGLLAYVDGTTGGSTGFSAAIMQAYNFAEGSLGTPATVPYAAHWANTVPVPEPVSLAVLMIGLAGIALSRRRF